MPEGDTIFRAARRLGGALAGETVTGFQSVFPHLNRVDADAPLRGRTILAVRSLGKHLLIDFSGDLTLRTHQRMNGSWHLYARGAPWRRSSSQARIILATGPFTAAGFAIPVAEFFVTSRQESNGVLNQLGPDLLGETWDEEEAWRRLRAAADLPLAEALLRQQIVCGIGNVFKSEILFVTRLDPGRKVSDTTDGDLRRILEKSRLLLRLNTAEDRRQQPGRGSRWTTGRLNPAERLWVYGRRGKPCFRCGTPIEYRKTGLDARSTYWCPRCQPAPAR